MSTYSPGDIVLVRFPFTEGSVAKLRPALVIALESKGDPVCCPIRSSPRSGTPCIPIGIEHFESGGLDLFSESYVQTDTACTIRKGDLAGKKGRVTRDYPQQIVSLARG